MTKTLPSTFQLQTCYTVGAGFWAYSLHILAASLGTNVKLIIDDLPFHCRTSIPATVIGKRRHNRTAITRNRPTLCTTAPTGRSQQCQVVADTRTKTPTLGRDRILMCGLFGLLLEHSCLHYNHDLTGKLCHNPTAAPGNRPTLPPRPLGEGINTRPPPTLEQQHLHSAATDF